jgi:anti-anti-sigma factor
MADRDVIKVKVEERDGMVVLSPSGEIGYQEAPAFRTYIRQAYDKKPRRLVADLSGVDYMSTPGLATLVEALQIANRSKTPLVLCGLNDKVLAIFKIARLDMVFKIVATVDLAVA